MMVGFQQAAILLTFLAIPACVKEAAAAAANRALQLDVAIAGSPNLSTIQQLLAGTSAVTAPYFAFLPDDTAFAALDPTYLKKLQSRPEWVLHRENLVLYHFTNGVFRELVDGQELVMQNQEVVVVREDATTGAISVESPYTDTIVTERLSDAVAGEQASSQELYGPDGSVGLVMSGVLQPLFYNKGVLDLNDLFPDFSILFELLAGFDLNGVSLSAVGDVTILAPTNDAFLALGDRLDELRDPSNSQELRSVLLNHVLFGVYPTVLLEDEQQLSAVGGIVVVALEGESIMVNNANIIQGNVLAKDGIVHGIDRVLLPAVSAPVAAPVAVSPGSGILASDAELSIFLQDLTRSGLLDRLVSPYTIFAPTDSAFEDFEDQSFLETLRTPHWIEHYNSLLGFHVVSNTIESSALIDGMTVDTLIGESVAVNGNATVTSLTSQFTEQAIITEADLVDGANVIHKIDSILLPSWFIDDPFAQLGQMEGFEILYELTNTFTISPYLVAGQFTVFLPTDEAFLKLGNDTLEELKVRNNRIELITLLINHITPQVLPTDFLVDGLQLPTFGSLTIAVSNVDGSISVNGATVGLKNNLFKRGIFHAIDEILTISEDAEPPETINDVLASDSDLVTFRSAVETVLLNEVFEARKSFTIFAPNNDAFLSLDQDFWERMQTPPYSAHLRDLLNFHIVQDDFILEANFVDKTFIEMRNEEMVAVAVGQDGIVRSSALNRTATIIDADLERTALAGVVHKTDTVLIPSFYGRSLLELQGHLEDYDILFDLISRVGGLGRSLLTLEVTVLAPNDDAFLALGSAELKRLIDPENLEELQRLLSSHVITEVYPTDILEDGLRLSSLGGLEITVTSADRTCAGRVIGKRDVTFNGANVVDADELASTGIAHGIDKVLGVAPKATIEEVFLRDTVKFASAYFRAGLNGTFAGVTDFTVFAPDDGAFDKAEDDYLMQLLSPKWVAHLQNLLRFHITRKVYLKQDLKSGAKLEMMNGEFLDVNFDKSDIFLASPNTDSSKLTEHDLLVVSNGVFHTVDTILLPTFYSTDFLSMLASKEGFSIFLELIDIAGRQDIFNERPLSVLVPSDEAFQLLGADRLAFFKNPANEFELENMLGYHILDDLYPSATLKNGEPVTNIGVLPIAVQISQEEIRFDNATVTIADMVFSNGVAHAIDRVLMAPESAGSSTFPTSASPTALTASSWLCLLVTIAFAVCW